MKKSVSLAITLALALSMSACGGNSGGSAEADVSATTSKIETVKDETTKAETTAPEETTSEETTTTESAVQASPAENFDFEENDGEITITKYKEEDVIIPAEINGKPVTVIGIDPENNKGAFQGSSIKSVVIPEGVTSMHSSAFEGCWQLTDISIPESLTEIITDTNRGRRSDDCICLAYIPFDDTPWLEAKKEENPLVIVNNMLIDGRGCSRSVEIPEGVTQICANVFYGCTTITNVSIPNGVKKIGEQAFYGCERLTEIVLPDSVNCIESGAFSKCTALENVTFPKNTVEMGDRVFGGFRVDIYEETAIPWLNNKIAENPLVIVNGNLINGYNCTEVIVIPDSVKSIAAGAFEYSQITSVTLPNGITKISDNLFSVCQNLTDVNIPDGVTKIGSYAFNFTAITSINIPDSVTEIDEGAFRGTTKLTNINIPDGVTEIKYATFYDCISLKSMALPKNLKKIGDEAFCGCTL